MYQRKAEQNYRSGNDWYKNKRYDIILIYTRGLKNEEYKCFPNAEILEYPLRTNLLERETKAIRFRDAKGKIRTKYFDHARFHEVY